jgi:dimethylglycine dehydrogenase
LQIVPHQLWWRAWLEVHTKFDDAAAVYTAIRDAGAKPFGMYALNAMRIEKGYRTWKGDLSTDYTLLEAGMERFIRFNKDQDFPGKAALLAEKQTGSKKTFCTLTLDTPATADAPYMSPIMVGDKVVGETTSGDWGFRVNKSIALGMLRTDLNVPGTKVEIEIYGGRYVATVHEDAPLWDAENARIRA